MALISFDQTKKRDIVLIGRAAIDLNPNEIHRPLSEAKTFSMYLGGSPANLAVGINKLGHEVGFIGCVSNDQFGDFIENYFKARNIDTSQMTRAKHGENLGLTFTEILSPTESSILMYRNMAADFMIAPEDVHEDYLKDSKMLLISGTALAASPSREACFMALRYAKKHGVCVIFDIDHRDYTWKSKADMAIYYSLVGEQSDIIIGSRQEFELMEYLPEQNTVSDHELAEKYMAKGAKIVIIKHGAKGSVAYTAEQKAYVVQSYKIKLLKSFGGGDAYGSAFIHGLLAQWPIEQCLQYATAHAAMVVASHSCSDAMQTAQEITDFITAHSDEQVVREIDWHDEI